MNITQSIARHRRGETMQDLATQLGVTRLTLSRRMRAAGYIPASTRRGHWPAGKRRHAEVRVRGYPHLTALIAAVTAYCADHYGAQAELARHLAVHRKTLQQWLGGERWPAQATADRIAAWIRERRRE